MSWPNRRDAMALGQMFAADNIVRDFPNFLAWASGLDPDTIRDVVGARTAELFIDRTATLLTPRDALDLAVRETGTLSAPLRGIRPMGTAGLLDQVTVGEELYLQREHDNTADLNAITVHLATGVKVAYLAREVARVLAPLADLDGGPQITATLATRPAPRDDTYAGLERHDAVKVNITVIPRPPVPAKGVVLRVIRRECWTSLSANCGCWHAPQKSVSAILTLAPDCHRGGSVRQWRHSGCRHGRWRRGRHAARNIRHARLVEPGDVML
jgi:hypothetical protein